MKYRVPFVDPRGLLTKLKSSIIPELGRVIALASLTLRDELFTFVTNFARTFQRNHAIRVVIGFDASHRIRRSLDLNPDEVTDYCFSLRHRHTIRNCRVSKFFLDQLS